MRGAVLWGLGVATGNGGVQALRRRAGVVRGGWRRRGCGDDIAVLCLWLRLSWEREKMNDTPRLAAGALRR